MESLIHDCFGKRRKISGHWGGNYAIEKLYGKSSEQRRNRIVDYVFEGYEPREEKDFYERSEQTDITTIPKLKQHIRQNSHIQTPVEIETPIESEPASPIKREITINEPSNLLYSEIMMSYDNKSLNVDVLHLQNKRVLNIPIKDLKQHCLRIRFSPPYIKIYLGKHLIFPFDLGRILSRKTKRSDEEKWREATQRMPEITTLKADKDTNILGELPLVYLHSSVDKDYEDNTDFIFKDKYDYLPPTMTKCYNRHTNLGKPLYRDTKKIKCLQRNLAHINEPEKFVTESQMSFKKLPAPDLERVNAIERFKNFLLGPSMAEESTEKIEESSVVESDEDLVSDQSQVDYKFHNKIIRDSIALATEHSKSKVIRYKDNIKSPEKSKSFSDASPRPKPLAYRYDQTKGVPIIVPLKKEEKNTPKPVLTPKEKIRMLELQDFEKAFYSESDTTVQEHMHEQPALKSKLKSRESAILEQPAAPEIVHRGIISKRSKRKETIRRFSQETERSYISVDREKSMEKSIPKDKDNLKKSKMIQFFGPKGEKKDKNEREILKRRKSSITDLFRSKKSKRKGKDHILANFPIKDENKEDSKETLKSHLSHHDSLRNQSDNISFRSLQNKHYSKKTEDKKTKNIPYFKEISLKKLSDSSTSSTDKQIELDFDSLSKESNRIFERSTSNKGFGENSNSNCSASSSHYSWKSCNECIEIHEINRDYGQNYSSGSISHKRDPISPHLIVSTSGKKEPNRNEAGTVQFNLKENEFLSKDKDKNQKETAV